MAAQLSSYLPSNLNLHSIDARVASTTTLATFGTIAALSAAWVTLDYTQWKAFGTGGTPPTPSGYWRMTKIRWHQYWSADDMRDASPLSDEGQRYLKEDLPTRQGNRPQIVGRTMPQRQKPVSRVTDKMVASTETLSLMLSQTHVEASTSLRTLRHLLTLLPICLRYHWILPFVIDFMKYQRSTVRSTPSPWS